ncbi:ATP-dependent RNA helicase [Trypanosoma grayi]|uniref:ATP-dependent RNA helicase n=1 Tax=Trypanosoma grayi TaxID=71804 RepID=UPI0004F43DB9|nr:ATP-dependent RNA helicase [Trypanosoma grayi]KEG12355.1 ATP-dependent RNA helicase [Trypanosoma grayi]
MASAIRHGRKGGKVAASHGVAPRVVTPESAMSPASLQTPGEGTTIISDPNAAHPFDPDAIVNAVKKPTTSEANVLQFDAEAAVQQVGKGVMVGRVKQVRTTTRPPKANTADMMSRLRGALNAQMSSPNSPKSALGLQELSDHNVVVTRKPQEALVLAVAIATTVPGAKVLVVVPKYFEVSPVKAYLDSLEVEGGKAMLGKFCGETFEGSEATNLWVSTAEMMLLYLTRMKDIAPFTHVVVPDLSSTTHLLSCFVKALSQWMLSGGNHSQSVRLVVTSERADCSKIEGMPEGLKIAVLDSEAQQVTEFSYGETCALVGKEMMEMERDSFGRFPEPTKCLIDYTAKVAADVVRCIIKESKTSQVVVVFTAEAREVLTALQDARIEGCAVYSGFKSTEETNNMKHRVYVMNHVRHALETENEYTMVLDMGTIRRPTAQHKSELFMAASTTEWERKTERAERISILDGKKEHCYFALYSNDVAAAFREDTKSLPDVFSVEDAFVQCARLGLPMNEVMAILPDIPAETTEQVMHNLAEKCMVANPQNLAITFLGEMTARLPVELDIACFIIGGCNIGFGEAVLAIGSVAALPFRSTTPLTYSSAHWNESTRQSREKYGGDIARQSDLLADTFVFIEWLKLRSRGEPTASFLDEILVQEFKLEKIEGLMNYMREQLTNYVFLEHFETLSVLESVAASVQENSTVFLLLESVALARRAAFIRDAGHLNEKERYASMAFVRTSKRLVPHNFIPSSIKWDTGKIMIPVILKNGSTILAGLFSLIHTPYFFASLLLLYPQVEYSNSVITDKGCVVYFGVSCNRQMKRFMVPVEEAAQILNFREKVNEALGCMQALRILPHPVSRTKFGLALKEYDRHLDLERLHKDIRRQLLELVTELNVVEHQGSFETFATHCTAPKETLPMSSTPATDVAMLHRFANGTLWEKQTTPHSTTLPPGAVPGRGSTPALTTAPLLDMDDDDDEVEVIQESFFMRHGPLIEDDDDK